MASHLDIPGGPSVPLDAVIIRTTRSSGPGGQHANVTASRVEAVLSIEDCAGLSESERARLTQTFGMRVSAVAQDSRSQLRNRELALERLVAKLSRALAVQAPRRPSRPSRGSVERRLSAKRVQSARKLARRRPSDD